VDPGHRMNFRPDTPLPVPPISAAAPRPAWRQADAWSSNSTRLAARSSGFAPRSRAARPDDEKAPEISRLQFHLQQE
jgi:hypothetical protein